MDNSFTSYAIDDRSYVAFVKREIHSQLLASQFTKTAVGEIDIIVSELTSNLIKHAGSGELLYRMYNVNDVSILEIISIDQGPGMADVQRMMKDGVSTTNTLGQGLGAIQRLSNNFHVYSLPNWGTICYVNKRSSDDNCIRSSNRLDINAICVPKFSEVICGDKYAVKISHDFVKVFLCDGLGHGEYAHAAATKACDFFNHCEETDPVEIIREMDGHVKKTRGLVGTAAVLNLKQSEWRICGVGNISTRLYGGISFKHHMSYNGIIGLNIPRSLSSSIFQAEKYQQLVMSSDGIRTRWELSKFPSILKYDTMILAAALYKDYNRKTDDSSVFIGKVILEK